MRDVAAVSCMTAATSSRRAARMAGVGLLGLARWGFTFAEAPTRMSGVLSSVGWMRYCDTSCCSMSGYWWYMSR